MLQVLFWLVDGLVNVMDFGPIRQACCSSRTSEIDVRSMPFNTRQYHCLHMAPVNAADMRYATSDSMTWPFAFETFAVHSGSAVQCLR